MSCRSRRSLGLGSLAVLVAVLASAAPIVAQQRAMTVVDLIDVPGLADPRVSPDGSEVLYVRTDTDWDANATASHIWRVAMDGSGSTQMTNGEGGESNPRWSPDGGRIAFVANRHDTEHNQVFVMPTRGGEAHAVSEHPTPRGARSRGPGTASGSTSWRWTRSPRPRRRARP